MAEIERQAIRIRCNGDPVSASVEPRTLLVYFLREQAGLTGTHVGCDTSYCGACTVLLDGAAVKSCTVFAVQADGRAVETVEGGDRSPVLHALQEAFSRNHALQCGFCTPGFLMATTALLEQDPNPAEPTIRKALGGNTCRCTGYLPIIRAVHDAAASLRATHHTSEGQPA